MIGKMDASARKLRGIIMLILLGLIMTTPTLVLLSQLSEEQARDQFNSLGCNGCHNGAVADSWDDILMELREVPEKYNGDLDRFAQNVNYRLNPNIKFQTWQDLVNQMAENVGKSADDPGVKAVFQYFENVATTPQTTTPPGHTGVTATPITEQAGLKELAISIVIAILLVTILIAIVYYLNYS